MAAAVGADGGRVLRRGGRFGRLILSVEETADGAAGSPATTIDEKKESAGVKSGEASVSFCADCPARYFDESRSSSARASPATQVEVTENGEPRDVSLRILFRQSIVMPQNLPMDVSHMAQRVLGIIGS